jgi:uncharacterized membrane protein YbaN (DUF454 family)
MMNRRTTPDRGLRWALATCGVIAVGIGGVGVVVPGLPTTIFLIIGSWCFARSCPWLEQRLIRNRLFAPYLRYLDGDTPMPMRARIAIIIIMWSFVAISVLAMINAAVAPFWPALVVAAALFGTIVVLRYRRRPGRTPASAQPDVTIS